MIRLPVWLPWLSPIVLAVGAMSAALGRTRSWQILGAATAGALALSAGGAIAVLWVHGRPAYVAGAAAAYVVAALVAFLGWTIGDYSRRYLAGEPGQARFVIAFLATLAAVSAVIASTNLGILIAAWVASSAALHHLLTFYRERASAVIVAHKKFLASRLAEICLVSAAVLLHRQWGTLNLGSLAARANDGSALPPAAAMAAVLVAAAVILKSAQLPLHGWLIQVMEAPTPVSALLHAGVVNLGGYVLIRLAPLISASLAAQALLVTVGSLTAGLAGLVMMTRVTIKVRLAWSTCAQMGFMLMECGLGLYDLALMHLVAHALYKAHAFLTAGDTVRESLRRTMIAAPEREAYTRSAIVPLCSFAIAGTLVFGSGALWHTALRLPAPSWIAMALLACGLATLLWAPAEGLLPYARRLVAVLVAAQVYLLWHWLFNARIGIGSPSANPLLAGWVLLCFLSLYLAQWAVSVRFRGVLPGRIYHWVYAGFYLDERFTRLTFRLWPVRIPRRSTAPTLDPRIGNDGRCA